MYIVQVWDPRTKWMKRIEVWLHLLSYWRFQYYGREFDTFSPPEKELEWLNSGRVTTDTVHRRFQKKSDEKSNELKGENYYCIECGSQIDAAGGGNTLMDHYNKVKHKHFDNCVYCSKPAHLYRYRGQIEVYHNC